MGEIVVDVGAEDIGAEVDKLAKWQPDFVLIHGFIIDPIPALIQGCRDKGLKACFLATFFATTKKILDRLGPLAEGYVGIGPYAYWWMDEVPMIRRIKAYTAEHYSDVTYRSNLYMLGYTSGLIAVEVLRKADSLGDLNYWGLVRALHSVKNLDTRGLTAPLTIRNNRFPVATVWLADTKGGIFRPAKGWSGYYLE
jgi:branched-chain amino acid transport system substrate-binding protein